MNRLAPSGMDYYRSAKPRNRRELPKDQDFPMPTRPGQPRRWLIILLLLIFAPIMPGKMNLCLLPSGEIHLEASFALPCGLADQSGQAEAVPGEGLCRPNPGEGACLDFTIGESTPGRQGHSLSPPATSLASLPQPVALYPAGPHHPRELPPAPSPHLKSHQLTVLRI